MNDNRLVMTRDELAANTGRNVNDITDSEYEKYLDWMNEEW